MKDFIPYEETLALKKLGFDEECLDKYDPRLEKLSSDMQTWTSEHYPETLMIPAPLYQQAFRWFREKHGLIGWVEGKRFYLYRIESQIPTNDQLNCSPFRTYEEAELECLKKLIDIVQGGNK